MLDVSMMNYSFHQIAEHALRSIILIIRKIIAQNFGLQWYFLKRLRNPYYDRLKKILLQIKRQTGACVICEIIGSSIELKKKNHHSFH